MMLARLCRAGISPNITSMLKSPVCPNAFTPRFNTRSYSARNRSAYGARSGGLSQTVRKAWHEKAYTLGEKVVIGSSVVGAGALCYYGLGMSSKIGIVEKSIMWPDYVKKRVKTIYKYIGGSIILSAGSVYFCLNSPAAMRLIMAPGPMAFFVHMGVLMASVWVLHSMKYTPGFGSKQIAWATCCGILGTAVAPLCYFGGPAALRAVFTTAGAVSGLTAIALCAPDRKFLNWAGPLGLGLGAVFAASVAAPFTSPFSAVGSSLYAVSLYGGLLLFSAFLLYDTQKAVAYAEEYPPYDIPDRPFDPINAAMSIYMDILNIFMRLAAMNSNSRKK